MPTKRIIASGVKRPAKLAQSPDRTLSLKAATCLAARSLIGSPLMSAPACTLLWPGRLRADSPDFCRFDPPDPHDLVLRDAGARRQIAVSSCGSVTRSEPCIQGEFFTVKPAAARMPRYLSRSRSRFLLAQGRPG